jgi:hypothetical protein
MYSSGGSLAETFYEMFSYFKVTTYFKVVKLVIILKYKFMSKIFIVVC